MDEGKHPELQGLADAELENAFIYLTRHITRARQGGTEPNPRILSLRDAIVREYDRRHGTLIQSAPNVVRMLSEQ